MPLVSAQPRVICDRLPARRPNLGEVRMRLMLDNEPIRQAPVIGPSRWELLKLMSPEERRMYAAIGGSKPF